MMTPGAHHRKIPVTAVNGEDAERDACDCAGEDADPDRPAAQPTSAPAPTPTPIPAMRTAPAPAG